ncbi:MAG: hypothetical protein P8X63_08390 [Desulfuromonadaceae bacterium]
MKIRRGLLFAFIALGLIAGPAYAKHGKGGGDASLPPGLQKKVAEGKPLPPGWQKKLSKGDILDDAIYSRGRVVVPLGRDGTLSIEVEGTILKVHEKTRKIIDILN